MIRENIELNASEMGLKLEAIDNGHLVVVGGVPLFR
jgi:hypothetical protein